MATSEAVASRRLFLKQASAAAIIGGTLGVAGCTRVSPLTSTAMAPPMAEAEGPTSHVFDLHSHIHFAPGDSWSEPARSALNSGLGGAFLSVVPDSPAIGMTPAGPRGERALEPGEAWTAYRKQLEALKTKVEGSVIDFAENQRAAVGAGRSHIAGFIAVEGAHLLEGRIERLEQIYRDGVRSLQLVHYVPNDVGDDQTSDARFGGLSEFGRQIVRECNRLGILIDVAHASIETTRDVVELSNHPVIASHTVLEGGTIPEALSTRALTNEHAQLIAQGGGLIGAWPVLRTREEYAAVMRGEQVDMSEVHQDVIRLVDAVGADHVGLGTDFAGGPIIIRDYGQLPTWWEGLRAGGLSDLELTKVMSSNAWRVIDRVMS